MNDTILTSINEGDIKTHFTNETSKKCIFNSDLKAIEASFFAKVPLAKARTTFLHPEMDLSCRPKPQDLSTCMLHLTKQRAHLTELALLSLPQNGNYAFRTRISTILRNRRFEDTFVLHCMHIPMLTCFNLRFVKMLPALEPKRLVDLPELPAIVSVPSSSWCSERFFAVTSVA